jgi:ubiquinone/menaquinone biosynthesis C-methylase UbiE
VDRTAQTARTNPYTSASLEIIRRHATGVVLDLGAGHPRDDELFPNVLRQEVIHFASTHVVSNTPRLPFRDSAFDAVVCESVLEHVADPWAVAEEIHRILKPGGVIRVDSAFLQPFHGDPNHYFNMTVPGIERVFRRFRKVRSGVDAHQAPSFSIRMLLGQYRDLIRDPALKARIEEFLTLPFEQSDRELTPAEYGVVGAGVYFEGRKDPG